MRRLYRSQTNKKIAGICGGIGEMLDVDPTLIRLLAIIALFATGFFPLFFGYIIAMFLVPIGSQPASASSAGPSSASSAGPSSASVGRGAGSTASGHGRGRGSSLSRASSPRCLGARPARVPDLARIYRGRDPSR